MPCRHICGCDSKWWMPTARRWRSGATGRRFRLSCAARRGPVSRRCRPRNSNGKRLRDWDFGELPEAVSFIRNGIQLRGYPALVAETDGTLALRVLDSPARAEAATRAGLRRLIGWRLGPAFKSLARDLPHFQRMTLHYVGLGTQEHAARGSAERHSRPGFSELTGRCRATGRRLRRCWNAAKPDWPR